MSMREPRRSDKTADIKNNSTGAVTLLSGRKGSQPVIDTESVSTVNVKQKINDPSQFPVLKVNTDHERIQLARRKFSQSNSIKATDSSPQANNTTPVVASACSPRQRPPLPHSTSITSSGVPKTQPRVYGGSGRVSSACSVLPSTSSSKISQSPRTIASTTGESTTTEGIFNFKGVGSQSSLGSKTTTTPNSNLTPRSPQSGKSIQSHISGSGLGGGGKSERFLRVRSHLVHQPSNESCESSFSYTSNVSNNSGVSEETDIVTSCSTAGSGYETERSTSKHCSRTSSPQLPTSIPIKSGTSSSASSVTQLSVSKWQKALLAIREWKRRGSVKKRMKDGTADSKNTEYVDPVYQTLKSAAKERDSSRTEPKNLS